MTPKRIKDKSSKNRFTSGEALTEKEFMQGIERAEKGTFYTVQESMKQFESWLNKREKK
ncbi:MAG: hypothetical protein GVY20_11190 [Bacteroidetes bacterium]|jgi:predicted transcriptional regulator|nr:hypothetical protein [Bacteroidota bacterium]